MREGAENSMLGEPKTPSHHVLAVQVSLKEVSMIRALFSMAMVHFVWTQPLWRHDDILCFSSGLSADCQNHFTSRLFGKRPDRLERSTISRDHFIADSELRGGCGKAIEHA